MTYLLLAVAKQGEGKQAVQLGELTVCASDNLDYVRNMKNQPMDYPHAMEVQTVLMKMYDDSWGQVNYSFIVRCI